MLSAMSNYTSKPDSGLIEYGLCYRVVFDILENYVDETYII